MNRLATSTSGRTFLPKCVIYPILAFGFLSAYVSSGEAKHSKEQKAIADSIYPIQSNGDPLINHSRSDSVDSRVLRNKHYPWRHHGKIYSQGYQGKRIPQGYQGKPVPQGYQVNGYSRRAGDRLRLSQSSPRAKRSPYARRSSTIWKQPTPFAKTRSMSRWHTPHTFGMGTERNLNSSYITPDDSSAPTTSYSSPFGPYQTIFGTSPKKTRNPISSCSPFTSYGSNPYGMPNDNSQENKSGTSQESPAWPNYSLFAPGWSEDN